MMYKKEFRIEIIFLFILIILLFVAAKTSFGQEHEWNSRVYVELTKKINKKISVSFNPEIRFTEDYAVDEYFFETGLEYKMLKYLEAGASYRFLVNERENKSTEYFNRYALDIKGNYNIKRLGFQLRTRYTNYNEIDDDNSDNAYLRYRLKMKYNIAKSKFTPFASMELFHQLNDGEINKTRKTIGLDYKISKRQNIEVKYQLQYNITKEYTRDILGLGYSLSF